MFYCIFFRSYSISMQRALSLSILKRILNEWITNYDDYLKTTLPFKENIWKMVFKLVFQNMWKMVFKLVFQNMWKMDFKLVFQNMWKINFKLVFQIMWKMDFKLVFQNMWKMDFKLVFLRNNKWCRCRERWQTVKSKRKNW